VTPADWRRKADHADRQAEQAASTGDTDLAMVLSFQAIKFRETAGKLERALTKGTKRSIQREMLAAEPRKSQKYTSDADTKDFLRVANAAGHTLNSVAKAVRRRFGKGSHVNIGKALRGEKSIRPSWASYIASLTVSEAFPKGFEATSVNWPGGWAAED